MLGRGFEYTVHHFLALGIRISPLYSFEPKIITLTELEQNDSTSFGTIQHSS